MPAQNSKKPRKPNKRGPSSPARPASKYAPTAWATAQEGGPAILDVTVPSGQLCQVRTVGVQGLVEAGILSEVDSLTTIVAGKFIKEDPVTQQKKLDVAALAQDQEALPGLFRTVSKVVQYAVLQPHLELPPEDPEDRVDGTIYTDTVDMEDMMYIFQLVMGGTRDLERFRGELIELLASVEAEPDVPSEAERAVPSSG